jgi:hypothetical protein
VVGLTGNLKIKNPEVPGELTLALLFALCLSKMPYSYYEFIRFAALIGFTYLGYKSYQERNKGRVFTYAALAILFQPLFKIYLGRILWI